ncbi:hypothetical protein STEG23_026863 [Scotinomys teguina]
MTVININITIIITITTIIINIIIVITIIIITLLTIIIVSITIITAFFIIISISNTATTTVIITIIVVTNNITISVTDITTIITFSSHLDRGFETQSTTVIGKFSHGEGKAKPSIFSQGRTKPLSTLPGVSKVSNQRYLYFFKNSFSYAYPMSDNVFYTEFPEIRGASHLLSLSTVLAEYRVLTVSQAVTHGNELLLIHSEA